MFYLSRWPSIRGIALSGDLPSDATRFLVSNGKRETAAHCMAVGNTSGEIAARFGLDISVATTAAWLHDISNGLQPSDMLDYALDRGWAIDGSERRHPFLLHQRLSAVLAKELFGIKNGLILSAVECRAPLYRFRAGKRSASLPSSVACGSQKLARTGRLILWLSTWLLPAGTLLCHYHILDGPG